MFCEENTRLLILAARIFKLIESAETGKTLIEIALSSNAQISETRQALKILEADFLIKKEGKKWIKS